MEVNRSTIAARYNNERKSNRLASCNKFGFGLKYSNAEIRAKVDNDLFSPYAWPGGYPVIYIAGGCDVLCAACARAEVIDNRGTVATDIYEEGPVEYCASCNREIESAYGDPDAEPEDLPASDRWSLADDGTLDTVLACNVCQYWVRFSDRSAAALFIEDDEDCPICAHPLTADDHAGMFVFNG